jgi:hypothetical protein
MKPSLTTILLISTLTTVGVASAEYSYPVESDKYYSAMALGEIAAYGTQCEYTSDFYLGLNLLQLTALEKDWGVDAQLENTDVKIEISKTDEFKQGVNRMYREGCASYKQRLQALSNNILEAAIK